MGNRSKLLLFDPDKKMSHTATIFEDTRPLDVICMGRVAVDLYAEQVYSHLKDTQSFRKYLGGCAGNTAVGTARLGFEIRHVFLCRNRRNGCFFTEHFGKRRS